MVSKMDKAKGMAAGVGKQAGQAIKGRTGIYSTLAKEHGMVDALLDELVRTTDRDAGRRRELFAKVKTEVLSHAKAEDAAFYSPLATHPELRDKIAESRNDHAELEKLLNELDVAAMDDPTWLRGVERLKDMVERHAEMEENEVFPIADRLLSGSDERSVDAEFKSLKEVEKQRTSPSI
ncbi:MAG: hemerythrin domain-containing protein [Myxococcales bacterium]|nr:hemerythrin domain-containing protein [Myxococcales bacterium]